MSWLAESLIRLLRGKAGEAAVVVRESEEYLIRFANDEVTVADSWRSYEAGVYLAKGRRVAVAGFSGSSEDILRQALSLAEALDKYPEDPYYVPLSPRGPRPFPNAARPFDLNKALDLVWEAIQAARAEGAERSAGALSYAVRSTHYADSLGNSMSYKDSAAVGVIRAFIGRDLAATWAAASRDYLSLGLKEAGARAASIAGAAKGLPLTRLENGNYRVLMSGLVLGHLMGYVISAWSSALNVLTGVSKYGPNDLGSEAASSLLTVYDLSLKEDRVGSAPFDYEGNPTNDTPVFEKGVLKSFLHNNRTAAKLGVSSTGNAAGPGGWTSPAPRHIGVAPGDMASDLDDALKELGKGVYIHNNWYTRFQNIREGVFSTVGRDVILVVEGGAPKYRARGVRIAERFDSLLRGVEALSKSAEQIHWWDMPYPATAPALALYGSLTLAY
jgi:PmbA protein